MTVETFLVVEVIYLLVSGFTGGSFLVVEVIYLLVSGFTGGYISGQKGRSPWEGIYLGLVFGPLGLITAACMPEPPQPDREPSGTLLSAMEHERVSEELAAMSRGIGTKRRSDS